MEYRLNFLSVRSTAVLGVVAFVAVVLMPISGAAQAEESAVVAVEASPEAFVTGLLDELKAIDEEAGDDRDVQLRETLLRHMAVRQLQRYLIRGNIQEAATDAQTEEYNELFASYISAAIGDSMDRMVERRIDIETVKERRPGDFIVRSKVFSDAGEARATLDWRIRSRGGQFRLTDFMVDGQSFTVERKAQFTAMVRNDGFVELLDHMREVIADQDEE